MGVSYRLHRMLTATMVGLIGAASIAVTQSSTPAVADDEGPDHVRYWNTVLLDTFQQATGDDAAPTRLSRAAAMMYLSIYDAVGSLEPNVGAPYLTRVSSGFHTFSALNPAIDYAAVTALRAAFPTVNFDDELDAALAMPSTADESEREIGRDVGTRVGQAMVAQRLGDGSADTTPYVAGTRPGDWRPTEAGTAAVSPNWGKMRPFVLSSGSQFRPPPPAGIGDLATLLASPVYGRQFNEVRQKGPKVGSTRSAEETAIAHFWANDLDGTYKPVGQLLAITTTIVNSWGDVSSWYTCQVFAAVAAALADAAVVAWDAKYDTDIDLWRPDTAIDQAVTDGNPNTEPVIGWEPLASDRNGTSFSPPFPAYVSGHATFAGAWAGIMRRINNGDDAVSFTATTDDPFAQGVTRHYELLSVAARENADSRIFLGVHYRWDADEGLAAGERVAGYVFDNLGISNS